jgi:hypothetical protein
VAAKSSEQIEVCPSTGASETWDLQDLFNSHKPRKVILLANRRNFLSGDFKGSGMSEIDSLPWILFSLTCHNCSVGWRDVPIEQPKLQQQSTSSDLRLPSCFHHLRFLALLYLCSTATVPPPTTTRYFETGWSHALPFLLRRSLTVN